MDHGHRQLHRLRRRLRAESAPERHADGQLGQPVSLTNPGPQEGIAGTAVTPPASASDSGQTLSYSATGLPAGTSISASTGAITGTPTTAGTSTVTITAQDGTGAFATASFTWTVTRSGSGIPSTPLLGYQGLCLDLANDDNTNGTKVQIWDCNGTNGQQWTENPDGTVRADGKCLDIKNDGGITNGSLVQMWDCTGGSNQVWQPQPNGELMNPQTGMCLDDTGSSSAPGTQVQVWGCSGNQTQIWVSPASSPSRVISLRAHANGEYVTADNAGTSIANRTSIGTWEEFDEINDGNGNVTLRAHANNQYVCADNAGTSPLIANRSSAGWWETFKLTHNSDGSISLRALANNEIVTADNAGASPLIANRTSIGTWEEFDLITD